MKDRKKIWKLIGITLGAVAVIVGLAAGSYLLWEQAPSVQPEPAVPAASPSPTADETRDRADKGTPFDTQRKDGVYTFLLAGNDDGTGNTDTIMVGKLDTVRHKLDFVSIPRDTIINVEWENRKLNSVYWGSKNNGGNGIDALRNHVKNLIGFDVDCYAVIDLDAIIQAVDVLGGVYFDVPQAMDYDDGPVIHLQQGYQLLDGEAAMGLCRYRKGYVNGDLERIEVQHAFLKAAAEQFIRLGNIPNVGNVTRLLADSMDTNLSAANLAYFIRQTLMCSPENINFYTAPNTPREVHALSYTFLDLYDWLELVNTTINPYTTPVTEGQLDLVYLHNGAACCTSVLNGAYYYQLDKQEAVPVQISATEEECQAEAETPANPELLPPPQPSPTMAPGYTPGDDDWLSFD